MGADPRLMEPVYLVEIQCPENAVGGIYGVLNEGEVTCSRRRRPPAPPCSSSRPTCLSTSPVGFTADLRSNTGGQAFPQCMFDHWQVLPGCPLTDGTKPNQIVEECKKRKGLKPGPP